VASRPCPGAIGEVMDAVAKTVGRPQAEISQSIGYHSSRRTGCEGQAEPAGRRALEEERCAEWIGPYCGIRTARRPITVDTAEWRHVACGLYLPSVVRSGWRDRDRGASAPSAQRS
jgi:hypothetical protein